MIKSLLLKNILCHPDLYIEFEKGFNILIGDTEAGKSAIHRAINLLFNNSPSIEKYRNWNCDKDDELLIEIVTYEGNTITRRKGDALISKEVQKNVNEYLLNGKSYRGMKKNEVPEDILKVLNIGDVNVQNQDDNFFLFKKSSGETAKYINKVVDLEIIHTTEKNIKSEKLKTDAKLERKKEELKEYKEKLKKYEFLEEAEKKIEKIEKLEEIIKEKNEDVCIIKNLVSKINLYSSRIDSIRSILKFEESIDIILKQYSFINSLENKKDEIERIVKEIKRKRVKIENMKAIIKFESNIDKAIKLQNTISTKKEEKSILSKCVSSIKAKRKYIKNLKTDLKEKVVMYEKEVPKDCPFCGQEIKHEIFSS